MHAAVDELSGNHLIVKSSLEHEMLNKEIKIIMKLTERGLEGFSKLNNYRFGAGQKKSFLFLNRFG